MEVTSHPNKYLGICKLDSGGGGALLRHRNQIYKCQYLDHSYHTNNLFFTLSNVFPLCFFTSMSQVLIFP